jgi:hypothetical protein
VMAQLTGSVSQFSGVVLYNLGKTNPPSILRLWGTRALVVVAGDKIYLRTLTSDQNLGVVAEQGVKGATAFRLLCFF